jgi:hypothetical protein
MTEVSMFQHFDYRKLGDFTYHVISDPSEIKKHLMIWILREWEMDHNQAPDEYWTVEWMNALPKMDFALEVLPLAKIQPHSDLMGVHQFQIELQQRAEEREESILRGISIEPLLINRNGFELMDGYTRYIVLKKYNQVEVYAYVGTIALT